jgi:diguanylate cyclase (GGDEF)-like protein
MGLIIFMEYLKVPSDADAMFNILDERIGIYDMRYFRERLHQEMSRSRRHKHMLSIALINIDHRHLLESVSPEVRLSAMRSVVTAVGRSLRDEDVMAASSDTELAVLMPELDGERAKIAVERILAIVSKISVELNPTGKTISLNGAAGVAPFYNVERATTDVLVARARAALDSMRESTYGRVMVSAEGLTSGVPELKSAQQVEELQEMPVTEDSGVAAQEMAAPELLLDETSEADEVLSAEAGETMEDTNGRHRKKSRGRKADNSEAFSNKLEVSET